MQLNSIPESKVFTLESDPEGTAKIEVYQATEAQNMRRSDRFATTTRVLEERETGDVIKLEQDINMRDLRCLEAYLVLGPCEGFNVNSGKGNKTKELFQYEDGPTGSRVSNAMTFEEFKFAWGMLPANVVSEIIRHVHDVNITWRRPGE